MFKLIDIKLKKIINKIKKGLRYYLANS